MKHLALIAAAIALAASPVRSAEPARITVREALALAQALRNLDGHMTVIKQNGSQDQTVMIPWEFGSGSLRLRIANDLTIVAAVEASLEKARQSIVKEILKNHDATEIKPGTPEYDQFMKQYAEILEQPAAGAIDLGRIKASELRLDKNEIGVTILQALKPIMDADQ